jgi:hypothetical protein
MARKKLTAKVFTATAAALVISFSVFATQLVVVGHAQAAQDAPIPLLEKGHAVDWWFVFKFNATSFPGCGAVFSDKRSCPFGGEVEKYRFSQQFVYATNENRRLEQGSGCVGATTKDPLGATFDQVFNKSFYYVIWNDQFYDDPEIDGCTKSCGAPWGHSKGMLAWNKEGEGFVLQVTTPSWPAAGSKKYPRETNGNTLGCIDTNNVTFSQHFFALRLNKNDLAKVLKALANASVVTDVENRQIVNNGGPADIQKLVKALGYKSKSAVVTKEKLSTDVELISKPSALHVPPWQLVSAKLGGVALRTATWWASPKIPSTTASTPISCWSDKLGKPGPVAIATTGQWNGKTFGLKGGSNHAKIGVAASGNRHYAIFGDLNQQGAASGTNCRRSQNGRGGLFFVIADKVLADSIEDLIKGETASTVNSP